MDQALAQTLKRHLGGLLTAALGDPDITEISINDDLRVWLDGPDGYVEATAYDPTLPGQPPTEADLAKLAAVLASSIGEVITEEKPALSAEMALPEGEVRAQIFRPPLTKRGHALILRKLASRLYPLEGTHDAYLESGRLTRPQLEAITTALTQPKNVLVVGGMASGKTTFANALLAEIPRLAPRARLVILQDTRELQCFAPNHLGLRTTESFPLERLTKETLRTGADRIVVGEIRDQAALYLLDAWLTHRGGLATFHADDALTALRRLDALCRRSSASSQAELIADAVGLVVVMRKAPPPQRRRVVSVHQVRGFSAESGFLLEPA